MLSLYQYVPKEYYATTSSIYDIAISRLSKVRKVCRKLESIICCIYHVGTNNDLRPNKLRVTVEDNLRMKDART